MKTNTVTSTTRRPANLAAAIEHDLTESFRAAHAARAVRQGPADYFIIGATFGFALAVIVLAVLALITR